MERFVKQLLIAIPAFTAILLFGTAGSPGQTMDDLNLQVHGYATQGFIFSTNNNWDTTSSTDGSAAWTEAVVNLSAQRQSRLRIGIQARYFLLGVDGNRIALEWAEGDFKVNERFGFRVGKVKTPMGLLNESQDIDPVHLWILLPQSIYALASRNSTLAHYGAVAYGSVSLGERLGDVRYRAFGGQRVISADDGSLDQFTNQGFQLPNGLAGRVFGGMLQWRTPLRGLMVGASEVSDNPTGSVTLGSLQGEMGGNPLSTPHLFARYERNKVMLAGEFARVAPHGSIRLVGIPPIYTSMDQRAFYVMASYKPLNKLTGGLYFSSSIDGKAASASARYQKDWTLSGRYDFNPYLYLKLEQHFIDGTQIGYSVSNNSAGLKPNTRMTLLKLGVSF
jgi:hypothetical protein